MRSIFVITLLLVCLGVMSYNIEGAAAPNRPIATTMNWVRTVNGWEHPASWESVRVTPPTLHPLIVAAAECLSSCLGLLAFRRDS
jgi:hypothetical protein